MSGVLRWQHLGRVYVPPGPVPWMRSHGQVPSVIVLPDRLRVLFTCRGEPEPDGQVVAQTSWVDLDRKDPTRILDFCPLPLLPLGGPGSFDETGIMPGAVLPRPERGEWWLYYQGWSRAVSTPYRWAIGLAISRDGGRSFSKYSDGPLLAPSLEDPLLLTCPCVRPVHGGFEMLYQSGLRWLKVDGRWEPVYQTRRAFSTDGVRWDREGDQVLALTGPDECHISTSVFHGRSGRWHMVFARREAQGDRAYRLAYASSEDGRRWDRCDELVGDPTSGMDWDHSMQCYPHVCQVGDRRLLFYCGNDFGRFGFGCAELVDGD